MTFWLLLTVNSITFGGLLFLLSAGFSLIFGLMRIPNLTHGSMFMLGAYFGATLRRRLLGFKLNFWLAALLAALTWRLLGALDRAAAAAAAAGQTIGAGAGDARRVLHGRRSVPDGLGRRSDLGGDAAGARAVRPRRRLVFPLYRLAIIVIAVVVADRAVADARPHAARRHDPRRRRRSRHGARRRHPRLAAVHHRLRARRRACRLSPA